MLNLTTNLKLVLQGLDVVCRSSRAGRAAAALCASALLLLQACASEPPTALADDAARDIDRLAATALAQRGIPGMAVVVMRGDNIVHARGYGVESLTRADAVTARTEFVHNSIGKHFAAAMTLALAEDGKLDLDDPVIQHLPDFSLLPATLSIRQVMHQVSGVREAQGFPALWSLLEQPGATTNQMREVVRQAPVDWTPGSRWSYSNTNYFLLQVLIEQVAGKWLGDLYAERFFRPRDLRSMQVCPFVAADRAGQAVGYVERKGQLVPASGVNNEISLGAGGVCGSALDLARWMRLLATGRIVSARSYAQMTTPARLADGSHADYGLGLALMRPDGVRRAGHGGIGFGYSSSVAYYPDAELTIAVLANRFGFPEALERQIARRLLGLPEPDRRDIGITPAQRQRWAGSYDVGMYGWMPKIFEREGRLWFELFGPATTYALIQTRDGMVFGEQAPDAMQLRFTETPAGVILRLQTFSTQDWTGFKAASPPR